MNWPTPEDMSQSKEVLSYADASMYEAIPIKDRRGPTVHLLWMTEDPLGAIAAACRMYEGKPTYRLSEISEEERWHYVAQVQKTHLKAPLEFVKFHFFIEGVDRAFTHQLVRQRTAVYAQESLRFAVKDNFAEEAAVPPSIAKLPKNHPTRQMWDAHMQAVQELYNYMIANGIPAEDARAALPQNTTTRIHYSTDLRNLSDHAGNRLCTQAQFVWREVFNKIFIAIRTYSQQGYDLTTLPLFKPVCYQMGHCPFKADFDRGCTIRERVDGFAKLGVPSDDWDRTAPDPVSPTRVGVMPINDEEWMLDERAAWQ